MCEHTKTKVVIPPRLLFLSPYNPPFNESIMLMFVPIPHTQTHTHSILPYPVTNTLLQTLFDSVMFVSTHTHSISPYPVTNPVCMFVSVCFPGGMVDKEDGTIIETSLREMEEELGIPPGDHTLLYYNLHYYTTPYTTILYLSSYPIIHDIQLLSFQYLITEYHSVPCFTLLYVAHLSPSSHSYSFVYLISD